MNIVLHQPEIAGNTGNIGRTCAATGTGLHLIEPLGFKLTRREIKRAGMDYWDMLDVRRYMNYREFRDKNPGARIWYATTKAARSYTEVSFRPDDFIMFGRESAGIPESILTAHPESCVRIPMAAGERSLNLSNAVSVALYEALRHIDYAGLERAGRLHHGEWPSE